MSCHVCIESSPWEDMGEEWGDDPGADAWWWPEALQPCIVRLPWDVMYAMSCMFAMRAR